MILHVAPLSGPHDHGPTLSGPRLDPRLAVVATASFAAGVSLAPAGRWDVLAVLTLILFAAWRSARRARGAGVVWHLLMPAAMLSVPVGFTTPGPALLTVPGLDWTLTTTGLERQIEIVARTALSVGATVLLATCTPLPDLIWAFENLGLPAHLARVLGLMARYLWLGLDETRRTLRARSAREACTAGARSVGWATRAAWAGSIVGSLLVRSLERGERVWLAMRARGHGAPVARTRPRAFRRATWLEATGLALGLAAVVLARIGVTW